EVPERAGEVPRDAVVLAAYGPLDAVVDRGPLAAGCRARELAVGGTPGSRAVVEGRILLKLQPPDLRLERLYGGEELLLPLRVGRHRAQLPLDTGRRSVRHQEQPVASRPALDHPGGEPLVRVEAGGRRERPIEEE